jgi:class 3 adenylate cyclase/tetratricopeptide (TPR) repeat protein
MDLPSEVRERVLTNLRGEERLVTVVFADMSDSVRRSVGLSGEEATALVNPLLETMVELMVRYGGRIDRFLGDGVLAVFGVPSIHEDDPIRAVRAALDLRERAEELGFSVSVGVNTGRVYFGPIGSALHEELTVMGPTVNLAARLQAAAGTGDVVVGEATRAHTSAAFELTPLRIDVKGLSIPVTAYRAERLVDRPEKVRGVEGLRAEMIGRDDELTRLRHEFDEGGHTVALVGSPGVGKSRLAAELRGLVLGDGGTWLEGRCLELTAGVAYGPFVDLFDRHFGTGDRGENLGGFLDELVTSGGLTAERADDIFPFLFHLLDLPLEESRERRVIETSVEQRKSQTIAALVESLVAVSTRGPLAVFLEDLHWSDSLSIDTVLGLQRAIAWRPLLLLLSYRPEVGAPVADLTSRLHDVSGFEELRIDELTRDEVRELITRLLGIDDFPDALESRIIDLADGNPFYVEELLRSLIQSGAISRNDGSWLVTGDVADVVLPESVEGVIMSRFDRLADVTRSAYRAASVLDQVSTTPFFVAFAGERLAAELPSMAEAGIIREERSGSEAGYAFVHALSRQAVYTNLLASQRAELHGRAAEALEKTAADEVEPIAYHYQRSHLHHKAVEFLYRAAAESLESFNTDAARMYLDGGMERIERLPGDEQPPWRSRYQARKGELLLRMALPEPARVELEKALREATLDPYQESKALRMLGQALRMGQDFEAADRAYDRAEAALDRLTDRDSSTAHRAWIDVQRERAFALYFSDKREELAEHAERVAPVVEQHGSAAQLADFLLERMMVSFVRDQYVIPPATVETGRRALKVARLGADPGRVAQTRFALGFALLWADQVEEAADVLGRTVEECGRLGEMLNQSRAAAYWAIALRRSGRLDEAEVAAGTALELADRIDHSYYRGHALAVLCWVEWRHGSDRCLQLAEEAYEAWGPSEQDDIKGIGCEFGWLAVWPLVAATVERGDLETALGHLENLLAPWERPLPPELAQTIDAALQSRSLTDLETSLDLAKSHRFL